MRFILTGFTQDRGFRVFAFEGVATGQLGIAFTVRADLDLSRRYGIRLQDLPLICREVLEHQEEGEQQNALTDTKVTDTDTHVTDTRALTYTHALTYTEDAMRIRATSIATARAEAALNKKSPRRPAHTNGSAWGSQGAQ